MAGGEGSVNPSSVNVSNKVANAYQAFMAKQKAAAAPPAPPAPPAPAPITRVA